jgi:uncharacterized protein
MTDEQGVINRTVRRSLSFNAPSLGGCAIPCIDIVGERSGPRLAVMAGMHINEVSSIAAVRQLRRTLERVELAGTVSLIPVLNLQAWKTRDVLTCPADGKNINMCFPGDPDGTFSSALAYSLLNDWAADAACLVDLHGADLCESIARYTVCQLRGESSFDTRAMEIARSFDVEFILALHPSYLGHRGRSVTGRAAGGQHAAFAEAGSGGLVEADAVAFHHDGVLRVAAKAGLISARDAPALRESATPTTLHDYSVFVAPCNGWATNVVGAGSPVRGGDLLTVIQTQQDEAAEVYAPRDGFILWRDTNPIVSAGQAIGGIGS